MATLDKVVAFLPAWLDACALYRMFIPHIRTPGSRFLFNPHQLPVEEFSEAAVVVVQRQCSEQNFAALRRFKELGMAIVYDLDDNLWNLPAANPGKRVFEQIRDGFSACIDLCSILTVSTRGLQSAVHTSIPGLKQDVVVIPNAIDFDLLHPPAVPKPAGGPVVVGYGGTNTHGGDVADAWAAITELVREGGLNVRFEFVGMPAPKTIAGHPDVRERAFVPVGEYFSRFATWGWDVTLAPLDNNRFNNSKTCIKALESAAIGAPCLMSPYGPYAEFCDYDPELKWLLCRTREEWKVKIHSLVSFPDLRQHLAGCMLAVVWEHFDIQTVAGRWREVFDRVAA